MDQDFERLSFPTAEEIRGLTADAQVASIKKVEEEWAEIQNSIEELYYAQAMKISDKIRSSASEGRNSVHYNYTERIACDRNDEETVDFISSLACMVSDNLQSDLKTAGFDVELTRQEERDDRDILNAPNEYLTHTFRIHW